MPIASKEPMKEIFKILDEHVIKHRRKVFLAYLMMQNVTDSKEHLKGLVELVKERGEAGKYYHVNLIRYNKTAGVNEEFECSD